MQPSPLPISNKIRKHPPPRVKLYIIIVVMEINIPRSPPIIRHKFTITGRPLIARIGRQHALNTHADALDRLHGRPACRAEEIETYYAVAVDVWVDGDRTGVVGGGWAFDELDFGGFY